MATEFFEIDKPFVVAFALDADITWGEVNPFETTKRKVEGKGSISDFVASLPKNATVQGVITAMNLNPLVPTTQKLVSARDALEQLADKMQPVLVVNGLYAGELVITRTEVSKSADGGEAINANISLERIETTTVGTANVPASRLRSKIKRKKNKGGGAAKGSKPTAGNGSVLSKLFDAGGINVPQVSF